jgi:uncharacterized protein (DUF362 family)
MKLHQCLAMTANKGIGKATDNPFTTNGKALVGMFSPRAGLKSDILQAVDLIGGFEKAIEKGDEVLLKPNFNTGDAPPASSDPDFVKALIELLYEHGASKVILGESSMSSLSTRKALEETGMLRKAEEAGAEVACFDEEEWAKAQTGGEYLREVSLPEKALEPRKLVYVCCMKTHMWARFTLSLKLAVGFVKPEERGLLHESYLQEKIADLNLVVHPNLIIMDGRKCFISGGPARGELRTPNIVLASGDRIAIDVEAIKVIKSFEGSDLTADPWTYVQIRRAIELELGAKNEEEYEVIRK